MKTQIESYIYDEINFADINAIIGICTEAQDEEDLRERIAEINEWREKCEQNNLYWGFGHNHFWLAENQGVAGRKRVLLVDFIANTPPVETKSREDALAERLSKHPDEEAAKIEAFCKRCGGGCPKSERLTCEQILNYKYGRQ